MKQVADIQKSPRTLPMYCKHQHFEAVTLTIQATTITADMTTGTYLAIVETEGTVV